MFDFLADILLNWLWLPRTKLENRIGKIAFVGSQGLSKGNIGEITCSGTILPAYLSKDADCDHVEAGKTVTIIGQLRSALIVAPKE